MMMRGTQLGRSSTIPPMPGWLYWPCMVPEWANGMPCTTPLSCGCCIWPVTMRPMPGCMGCGIPLWPEKPPMPMGTPGIDAAGCVPWRTTPLTWI